MVTFSSKLKWIIPVVLVAFVGFAVWKSTKAGLPEGVVGGSGQVEARVVDVVSREPLRVLEVLVDEGAMVTPGQVLVRMDTQTLEAGLAEARAGIASASERLAFARASIAKHKSELEFAKLELDRSENLFAEGGPGSRRELGARRTSLEKTLAIVSEAQAMLATATQQLEDARAKAEVVRARIDQATLKSTLTGRVLRRLAKPGELLAAGQTALTLVNLDDVSMEIVLPSEQAAAVKLGTEGRISLDGDPKRVVEGRVSSVSTEAQMVRVKIQLPKELATQFLELITGLRGVGYVKISDEGVWPERLARLP